MKMRPLLLLLLVVGFLPIQAGSSQAQVDDPLRIGLVTDLGDINDGGFNESAWEAAVLALAEFGAEIDYRPTIDPGDREANLAYFAESDYDIVIATSFTLQEATQAAALQYPDVRFIGVDMFVQDAPANLTGLIFPEDQAGFLAGVLAAGLSETNVIAGVFGPDIVPPVVAFKEGYDSGGRWAAEQLGKDITILSTYYNGDVQSAFSDPIWGATTAFTFVEANADVVFAAAGGTGNGALEETAAAAEAGEDVLCIGVDTDQWQTIPSAHPCLVSSAMKLITDGILELIRAYVDGTIEGGNFVGDVGLAPFHDFIDRVPDEVKALVGVAERGLRTGEILTCLNLDLSDLEIGVVTDIGQIDDGSFNEGTWNGVLAAAHCGATVDFIETQDTTDYALNIAEFAEQGFDIIVTVGFSLAPAAVEASEAYPDIRFIGVDQFYAEPVPNVTGLVFHEDRAGFLAGYLGANLTETDVLASVLGSSQIPAVVAFAEGFRLGAEYVNPDVEVLLTYHPGGVDTAFTDPAWGATTARQAMDSGADVIFGAGARTGNGALIETASAAGEIPPPYCIGVDVDQWFTVPEARNCLVSSSMKLLSAGVADLIVLTYQGEVPDGNYFGQVGLAPFHDFDALISDELQAELDVLARQLASGEVETGYNP